MLYFDNENICDAWSRAKDLYDRGDLEGIVSMKVSTEFGNQFGTVKASGEANKSKRPSFPFDIGAIMSTSFLFSDRNSKVIIFYCGPFNAERDMKRYGENVLNKMGYGRQKCHGYFPSRIYYKSDAQTLAGATSGKKHLYSLNF